MKVESVALSLEELQRAVTDYVFKHVGPQPTVVFIESHDKVRISIELMPGGLVEAAQFKRRTTHE